MSPTKKIKVEDVEITIFEKPDQNDFICITDIVKLRTDDARAADIIKNWLRTRSTIEFLGTWEALYNPSFKVVEFTYFWFGSFSLSGMVSFSSPSSTRGFMYFFLFFVWLVSPILDKISAAVLGTVQ